MRIAIDRTRLQAIIVGVPLVLCIAAGSYYYFFIRPRTGVTHEAFLVPDTAVRAVLKPVLVQEMSCARGTSRSSGRAQVLRCSSSPSNGMDPQDAL